MKMSETQSSPFRPFSFRFFVSPFFSKKEFGLGLGCVSSLEDLQFELFFTSGLTLSTVSLLYLWLPKLVLGVPRAEPWLKVALRLHHGRKLESLSSPVFPAPPLCFFSRFFLGALLLNGLSLTRSLARLAS